MSHSFNLIDQPWIPCITDKGKFVEVSLRGLLARAHELREISCETPIMSASILPLALAILHRVFGPEDYDEWEMLWQAGKFDMNRLGAYFEKWHDRFDLFHPERPFYQAFDNRVDSKSLIHIVHPMGNTDTLFNHITDNARVKLSPAEAARHLIAARYFKIGGPGPWGTRYGPSFTDSIFSRGVIFWACGANLFETLLLNLVEYSDEGTIPQKRTDEDIPAWEMEHFYARRSMTRDQQSYLADQTDQRPNIKKIPETLPFGYLDYLTWSNNRIQLIPEMDGERVVVRKYVASPAFNLSSDVICPQKRHEEKKEKGEFTGEYRSLYFREDKALWRSYYTLLPKSDKGYRPLAVVQWLSDLTREGPLDDDYHTRLMATGMLADKGKPIFYRRETMPLPLKLLRSAKYVEYIEGALGWAEDIDGKLRNALNTLAEHVLQRGAEGRPDSSNRKNLVTQWNAQERFWIELEPRFWEFIKTLVKDNDSGQAVEQWQDDLKRIAEQSLNHAISLAGDTPWAWKGGIAAKRQLQAGMKKVLS